MKKLVIYTSTRADYGLLKPIIEKLKTKSDIHLRLFVTGTHLSDQFGNTVTEIEKTDKDIIYYRVKHSVQEDSKYKNLLIMSDAIKKYGEALADDLPDLAIVLGDRHEALCFGLACSSLAVPIVHLHGGELTFGAIDDKYRHCLTKLSEWHFVACEKYRQRVIQLGENPKRVFNVGALGVDNALHVDLLSKNELEKNLNFKLPDELYVFTFHPETNSQDYGAGILINFLAKLEAHLAVNDAKVIVTGVNSDPGSEKIRSIILNFVAKVGSKALFIESLGMLRYLSVLKLATAVLGNSSSGVLEAFSLGTPAANIGLRQDGRERETSVIDFHDEKSLNNLNFNHFSALKKELSKAQNESIFGAGNASESIVRELANIIGKLDDSIKNKIFYDLK